MDSPSSGPVGVESAAGGAPSAGGLSAVDSLRSLGAAALSGALASLGSRGASAAAPQMEDLKTHATSIWAAARPWADFFNTKKFVPAQALDEVRTRLVDNLHFFSSNYVIIFCALSALGVIVHPMSVVCVVLCLACYAYLFLQNPGAVRIGPVQLTVQTKKVFFGVFTAAFLYITSALSILGTWAFFSAAISIVHAAARVSVKEPDFESEV